MKMKRHLILCGGDLALEPGDTQGSDEVLSEDVMLSTLLHEWE